MRRAIILPGVLVVVSIAAIIGVAAISRTDAHHDLADAALGAMQSRSLAWSGVLAAQSQLHAKREAILAGETPVVQSTWSTPISGGVGVVRLLSFSEAGDEAPVYLEFESAKLDLNTISVDALAKLDSMGPELAARIVDARGTGFQCVEAVAKLDGMTDEVLFGPMREGDAAVVRRGILESLTTFAFDPNTSVGLNAESSPHSGSLKIPISTPWSESMGRMVVERCGESIAQAISKIAGGQVAISRESDLLRAVKAQGVPQTSWGIVLDTFSVSDDLFRIGKTDINRAGPHVLALLPGFDEEIANRLVSTRAALAESKKSDLVWPLTAGVLDEDRFLQVVDFISTRTAQFRVRVEAGVRRETPDDSEDTAEGEQLDRAVVLEAVIDIAGDVPRIAYLRDVTFLQTARRLAREIQLRKDDEIPPAENGDFAEEDPPMLEASAPVVDENEPNVTDEIVEGASDVSEADSVSSSGGESASPPKLMDRRLGRWKNSGRS